MTTPPPGGWLPQQPGQPPHGRPQYGPPQNQFQPSAGYPAGYPFGQQPPPPPKGNSIKWLLVGIAVLLVLGLTIGATLLFTRENDRDQSASPMPSNIASAGDTGPISVVAEEPTCSTLNGINRTVAGVEANGWGAQRGSLGPKAEWTSEQISQVDAVATAMRNATAQVMKLSEQTPHRVIRELYLQYAAYGMAYVNSLDSYEPKDNYLADVNVSIGNAMLGICNAIEFGSASRAVAVEGVDGPTSPEVAPTDADVPERFLTSPNSACTAWVQREQAFVASTSEWEKMDPEVPGSSWSADQKAIQNAAFSTFSTLADESESAGRATGNPQFEDFAVLSAVYARAYAASGQSYVGADSWLSYTSLRLMNTVSGACQAAAE